MTMGRFIQGGWGQTPWKISFTARARALPEHVDFAIVGGGFTGLAAAAALARLAPTKTVLLLEAGRVGSGASGRTGGMVLAQTAAGDLPGLGDVVKSYRRILAALRVTADLELPGVWEIARGEKSMEGKTVRALKDSPIDWQDSGRVRAVNKVPGGAVDAGKVVSGLARAAEEVGAQIAEKAEVYRIDFGNPLRLRIRRKWRGQVEKKIVSAGSVLLATNAGSLQLCGGLFGGEPAEPKLTFALATAPLTKKQIAALGLLSRRPFYSVDLPYLWGRLLKNGGLIVGSGLVPAFGESLRAEKAGARPLKVWSGLERFDVRRGEPAARLRSLEERVRGLHPVLKKVRVIRRWCGPILVTREFLPVFQKHPQNEKAIVLGGFSGHGVALSVYLGQWAAEATLGRQTLPKWARTERNEAG